MTYIKHHLVLKQADSGMSQLVNLVHQFNGSSQKIDEAHATKLIS